MHLKVNEIFPSINGEIAYPRQGSTATFIRLQGCNLRCKYCDTPHGLKGNGGKKRSIQEVLDKVAALGLRNITVTGGEPLLQKDALTYLLQTLHNRRYRISVETNGSQRVPHLLNYIHWIVDYKLPSSGEHKKFDGWNTALMRRKDVLKFVVQDREDYEAAKRFLFDADLFRASGPVLAFSPVMPDMEPGVLANWIVTDRLDATFSLQIHKVIGAR